MENERWMTVGEYFREKGMDFPVETFKAAVRRMGCPHEIGSWPYKYKREDLDRAYEYMKERSIIMRAGIM